MQLLPLLAQIFHGDFACPYQIPYSFMSWIWHPDRRQFASAVKSRQGEGIPAIGLDALARPLGDQGGRDDRASMRGEVAPG